MTRNTMRIGILGAGRMAGALGTAWARAGHDVVIGARRRERAAALAARVGPEARSGTLREAAVHGQVVLLAVPHEGVADALVRAGGPKGTQRGRTLLDCTNPVLDGGRTLAPPAPAAANAPGAHLVKGFNLCHDSVWRLTPPVFEGVPLAVPLCGDDPGALALAGRLVADLGCRAADGGGLERARLLEATAAFAIGLWRAGEQPRAMLPPVHTA